MMTTRTLAATVAATSMAMVGTAAHGALLVHEGFDYDPGVYVIPQGPGNPGDLSGGVGFGSNFWWGHIEGLEFRIGDGGPGGTYLDGAGGVNYPDRLFRTKQFESPVGSADDGGVLWASVALSSSGGNAGGAQVHFEGPGGYLHAMIRLEEGGTYTLVGGHIRDAIQDVDMSTVSASTALASPDRIVLRFENLPENQINVTAWVNPGAIDEASLGTADMSVTFIPNTTRTIAQFTVAPGTAAMDDFMIAESYGDFAIPEPASLALMGLGGMLMLRRKRD